MELDCCPYPTIQQIGIVSFGLPCGTVSGGVYTKIDAFVPWIMEIAKEELSDVTECCVCDGKEENAKSLSMCHQIVENDPNVKIAEVEKEVTFLTYLVFLFGSFSLLAGICLGYSLSHCQSRHAHEERCQDSQSTKKWGVSGEEKERMLEGEGVIGPGEEGDV